MIVEEWCKVFPEADSGLVRKFVTYHEENPDVYESFRTLARAMRAAGRVKYSAWAIINVVRWHRDINIKGAAVFKISNDYIALYARLLIYDDPSFTGFFDLRPMKPFRRHYSEEELRRRLDEKGNEE